MKLVSPTRTRRHDQNGFLVIAIMAIITIMLIYIAANLHVLAALKRDIRLIEQKQIQRLNKTSAPTAVVVTNRLSAHVLR